MNFLYDDIVHVLQNTIDLCINSTTDRRGYVLEHMFTKFSEITQTDDRQTDGQRHIANVNMSSRSLIKPCILFK